MNRVRRIVVIYIEVMKGISLVILFGCFRLCLCCIWW